MDITTSASASASTTTPSVCMVRPAGRALVWPSIRVIASAISARVTFLLRLKVVLVVPSNTPISNRVRIAS